MGLLSLAKTVPSSIGTLVTTLGNVFTPHYTILYAKNDIDGLVSEVKLTSKIVSIIMTVPIAGFIALGKEFYTLWQPTKTADEILMIQILSVITCLMFIFACHTQCLMMLYTVCNKLKVPVFVNLGIGVVSTATVLLVLRFGNLGDSGVYVIAGVSSLLMSLRAILFMPMYSAKILGRKLTTFYPPILRGWLCFAVVFGAFFAAERLITIDSWVKLLIACLVLGVLGYALSVPLMLSRKEMKAVINKVKNKVKKKKAPSPAQPSAPSEDDGRVYGGRSCCGCSACADSCPKGAITMRPDEFGFVYPEIDEQLCVHCGKCRRACTFNRREEVAATETTRVYAVRSSDPVKLSQSSSGVIIPEIAGEIIARGGAVVAAAFDGDFRNVHMTAETAESLARFKGSRYIQSRTEGVYRDVMALLKSGREVLFIGTGCQTAALKNYVGAESSSLITVDILCRGVPSQKLFDDYRKALEARFGARLVEYSFRAKRIEGQTQDIYAAFENGESYSVRGDRDPYKLIYAETLSLRPSCYSCPYARAERVGDITVGDFWGLEKTMPDFASPCGTSLVIVSTEKGQALFDSVEPRLDCVRSDLASAMQPSLSAPASEPSNAAAFRRDYAEKGWSYVAAAYTKPSLMKKVKRKIKAIIHK